jgi:protein ImuB
MPRVASLYLPNLAVDRIRRRAGKGAAPPEPPPGEAVQAVLPLGGREEGHWRPGARWAENSKERRKREALQAEIDKLPLHQQPPIRELGRRSEPAPHPFRAKPKDEAGDGSRRSGERPPYDLDGAFWQQGRTLGPLVAREVKPEALPAHGTRLAASQPRSAPRSEEEPLITMRRDGQRMVVAAACPAAQSLGLHPGMPLAQARAMVRGLDIRPAEAEADAAFLQRLALFAARRWSPRSSVSDPTGLWLDLTGVAHLFGGERRMCARILRFCARLGLSARIAVAGTPGAAHALARHGPAALILCPEGGEADAIAGFPLRALRLDEDALSAARRLGLETIGDLLALPRGPLTRRFGEALLTRLDQALGRIAEPFDPIIPEDPPAVLARFAEPILGAEAIGQAIEDLILGFTERLRERGLASRIATLVCLRIDGEEQAIRIGTARATRDGAHLLRLFRMKIETIDPGFGIEAMRLVASRFEPLGPIPVEGELGGRPEPDLVPLIDRLVGRLGSGRLFRKSAVESDIPERSVRRVPPLGETASWPCWPRPIRMLSRPEPVEKVIAELPDQPPLRFSWRGRMHRVARADGPERVYGEWWRRTGEADAVRDYFQVEDEEGARFWLYRRGDGLDARTGDLSWWMQGMFG